MKHILLRSAALALLILAGAPAILAQGPMACERIDTPNTIRAEGLSELVSDVVLRCTGGYAVAEGAQIPRYQILISSNIPITARTLESTGQTAGANETLALIDDPPFQNQIGCDLPASGDACGAIAGAANNPNVFQGRFVQANTITFRGVPIAPPVEGMRIIRITNLRVRAASLATLTGSDGSVNLTVQMYDQNGGNVAIRDNVKTSAVARPGAVFSVRTTADTPAPLIGQPVLSVPPASIPIGVPQPQIGFNVKFTEGFAGAFRRRNVATSPSFPLLATTQAVPGLKTNTETGFFNSVFPSTHGMNVAGLADTGSRLRLTLRNIPAGVDIWVTPREVKNGTTVYSENSARAILTTANSYGAGELIPLRSSSPTGMFQIPVSEGTAIAVWEVVGANPATVQDISFGVAVTLTKAATTIQQANIKADGGITPLQDTATTALQTIPAFIENVTSWPAFGITNVLTVPYLSCVSAASFIGPDAAPASIATAYGSGLGTVVAAATELKQENIGGITVDVIDNNGNLRPSTLFYVSPTQVNFFVPTETALGPALVNLYLNQRLIASGYLQVGATSPGIFTANGNGQGVIAGEALLYSAERSLSYPVAGYNPGTGQWAPVDVDMGTDEQSLFITLYGTGIRGRTAVPNVRATVGGVSVPVTYAGPQHYYDGLDQVNIGPLPKTLKGKGLVDIRVTVGESAANVVQIQIR